MGGNLGELCKQGNYESLLWEKIARALAGALNLPGPAYHLRADYNLWPAVLRLDCRLLALLQKSGEGERHFQASAPRS